MTRSPGGDVSRRVVWGAAGVVFLAVGLVCHLAYRRFPTLYDADAYFHLAVARAYAEQGVHRGLDWARFSIMAEGFGDKDFLFHLFLVPFARMADATAGGFLALALLDALVAALLAGLAVRAVGIAGLLVPLLVFGASMDFTLRVIRLRPELLSLVLVLVAIPLAASGRGLLLGLVVCVYTLSYTAWQMLLGLCLAFFLYGIWVERRVAWSLVVGPALGVGLGLVLHPQFPVNLRVWLVQNLDFFLLKSVLPDVGAEVQSRTGRDLLVLNLGWWLGLAVLWRSRTAPSGDPIATRRRDFTLLATAPLGLLYVLMARFVTYFVPLATLAVAYAAGPPARETRLPWRGRVPIALALALPLLAAASTTPEAIARMRRAAARTFHAGMRADWEAFARAMPDGGRVFAPWAATGAFVFWAPRAVYLNVLDPVFMVAKDEAAYRLHLEVLEGREPDVPLVARTRFASDLFADDGQYPLARARLVADPRVEPLHEGVSYLYRFAPGRNASFLLDWKVVPAGSTVPPPLALIQDPATSTWPRATSDVERALEGYVDGRRLGPASDCVTFARVDDVDRAVRLVLEVSPYGSAEVFLDDTPVAAIPPRAAILGKGVILSLALVPGLHRLTIRTCPSEGHLGFYALVRSRA